LRKFISNNQEIPLEFFKQNKILQVKPKIKIMNNICIENVYKPEIDFIHIPSFYLKHKKHISTKDIQIEENSIKVNLVGLEYLNKEGNDIINHLCENGQKLKFYIKLNNTEIGENGQLKVFCWVLIKNSIFSYKYLNLNVVLAKKGYAKISNINTEGIYDETIFYNMSDLLNAEKEAKLKSLGIWRSRYSGVTKDYSNFILKENNIFTYLKKNLNILKMPKWQKILMKKNIKI